jgi:23S rRNA pseudouridine1911/1915/1917 synthase
MPAPERIERFTVAAEEAGQRLDRWLAARLPDLSRARIQELIAEGRVRVNAATAKASRRISVGERIEVAAAPRPPLTARPEEIPLDILYEDDDVVVVNKPAGMTVHAGAGAASAHGTLVNALLHRYGRLAATGDTEAAGLRPGIVHRLDKDTSGVLVVARTEAAHRHLGEQFQRRTVKKIYVALVHGRLKESGQIDLPVARDQKRRTRMTTRRPEGRAAHTAWRVLAHLEGGAGRARAAFSLAEVSLLTGRTHQIRVHFSAIGHPIVGDTLYGAPAELRAGAVQLPPLGRNFLHAARICFLHPRTGRPVEAGAPLPGDLRECLARLAAALGVSPAEIDAALAPFL